MVRALRDRYLVINITPAVHSGLVREKVETTQTNDRSGLVVSVWICKLQVNVRLSSDATGFIS